MRKCPYPAAWATSPEIEVQREREGETSTTFTLQALQQQLVTTEHRLQCKTFRVPLCCSYHSAEPQHVNPNPQERSGCAAKSMAKTHRARSSQREPRQDPAPLAATVLICPSKASLPSREASATTYNNDMNAMESNIMSANLRVEPGCDHMCFYAVVSHCLCQMERDQLQWQIKKKFCSLYVILFW